jgi:hypothetical protein
MMAPTNAGDDADHDRRREQPDAVGERARQQEESRGQLRDARPEPPREQRIRRKQLAAEVGRNEQHAHEYPADDVAQRELEKGHVAGVGGGGDADERQRARLGGDDRAAHRPPRHRSAAQEVVARRALEPREPRAEGGDGGEIQRDDGVVERREHAPV